MAFFFYADLFIDLLNYSVLSNLLLRRFFSMMVTLGTAIVELFSTWMSGILYGVIMEGLVMVRRLGSRDGELLLFC